MEENRKDESNKKVMVAIDESDSSYHALIWVLDNLKETITKSPLVLFSAQPLPKCNNNIFAAPLGAARLYFPISATPDLMNSIQEQNKKVSLGLLEKARGICANRGVNVETFTEVGDPKEAICNATQKYKINLLVVGIGNHATGIFKRVAPQSLSNYCLNNAKCSVLIVTKPE